MCKFENIKITEGNDFSLLIPLKRRTYISNVPIDEDVDIMSLSDIVVKIGGVEYAATKQEDGVLVAVTGLAKGTHDVVLTATYGGGEIRAAYFEAVTIVDWSYQSDAEQYLQGAPIEMQPAFVIYCLSDAELEQLKEQYREAIAAAEAAEEAAEQAKEDWEQKAAELDGVAQEATSQEILTAVENIDIDTSDLAKETSVKDGNDTAISVGKEIRSEVGTGSDTAAETGTLFAVVKWVKDKVKDIYNAITDSTNGLASIKTSAAGASSNSYLANVNTLNIIGSIGTPGQGQPSDLFAAIAANAGIPTLTIPDSTASQELAPNALYIFATRTSTLTLTLGTPIVGIANEYHFFVVCGSTAPTIIFPAGISWNGGSAPTIAASKTYEVSILNNVAAYFEV